MSVSPILIFHICSGTVGVFSGFTASFLRKGSRSHRLAGNAFFISMLGLGASGAFLGLVKLEVTNVFAGVITIYLVTTAWLTARRKEGVTSIFDWIGLLTAVTIGAVNLTFGMEAALSPKGSKAGVPAVMYFVFALVALLAAAGDLRMLLRHGIFGTQRLVRHLWRMCYSFFIASGSLFLARPHLFPMVLRKAYIIVLLGFFPLLLMIFWLIRLRFTNLSKRKPMPHPGDVYSVQT